MKIANKKAFLLALIAVAGVAAVFGLAKDFVKPEMAIADLTCTYPCERADIKICCPGPDLCQTYSYATGYGAFCCANSNTKIDSVSGYKVCCSDQTKISGDYCCQSSFAKATDYMTKQPTCCEDQNLQCGSGTDKICCSQAGMCQINAGGKPFCCDPNYVETVNGVKTCCDRAHQCTSGNTTLCCEDVNMCQYKEQNGVTPFCCTNDNTKIDFSGNYKVCCPLDRQSGGYCCQSASAVAKDSVTGQSTCCEDSSLQCGEGANKICCPKDGMCQVNADGKAFCCDPNNVKTVNGVKICCNPGDACRDGCCDSGKKCAPDLFDIVNKLQPQPHCCDAMYVLPFGNPATNVCCPVNSKCGNVCCSGNSCQTGGNKSVNSGLFCCNNSEIAQNSDGTNYCCKSPKVAQSARAVKVPSLGQSCCCDPKTQTFIDNGDGTCQCCDSKNAKADSITSKKVCCTDTSKQCGDYCCSNSKICLPGADGHTLTCCESKFSKVCNPGLPIVPDNQKNGICCPLGSNCISQPIGLGLGVSYYCDCPDDKKCGDKCCNTASSCIADTNGLKTCCDPTPDKPKQGVCSGKNNQKICCYDTSKCAMDVAGNPICCGSAENPGKTCSVASYSAQVCCNSDQCVFGANGLKCCDKTTLEPNNQACGDACCNGSCASYSYYNLYKCCTKDSYGNDTQAYFNRQNGKVTGGCCPFQSSGKTNLCPATTSAGGTQVCCNYDAGDKCDTVDANNPLCCPSKIMVAAGDPPNRKCCPIPSGGNALTTTSCNGNCCPAPNSQCYGANSEKCCPKDSNGNSQICQKSDTPSDNDLCCANGKTCMNSKTSNAECCDPNKILDDAFSGKKVCCEAGHTVINGKCCDNAWVHTNPNTNQKVCSPGECGRGSDDVFRNCSDIVKCVEVPAAAALGGKVAQVVTTPMTCNDGFCVPGGPATAVDCDPSVNTPARCYDGKVQAQTYGCNAQGNGCNAFATWKDIDDCKTGGKALGETRCNKNRTGIEELFQDNFCQNANLNGHLYPWCASRFNWHQIQPCDATGCVTRPRCNGDGISLFKTCNTCTQTATDKKGFSGETVYTNVQCGGAAEEAIGFTSCGNLQKVCIPGKGIDICVEMGGSCEMTATGPVCHYKIYPCNECGNHCQPADQKPCENGGLVMMTCTDGYWDNSNCPCTEGATQYCSNIYVRAGSQKCTNGKWGPCRCNVGARSACPYGLWSTCVDNGDGTTSWSKCTKDCPAGETDPHTVCSLNLYLNTGKMCEQVAGCGVSDDSSKYCPPGQSNPHKECKDDGSLVTVNTCGVSVTTCCPKGQTNPHKECNANTSSCVSVNSCGADSCSGDSSCKCTPGTKKPCACGGEQVCQNDGTWTDCPANHAECTNGKCSCKTGAGKDSCKLGEACCDPNQKKNCPCGGQQVCKPDGTWSNCPDMHQECINGKCQCLPGVFDKACDESKCSCTAGQTQSCQGGGIQFCTYGKWSPCPTGHAACNNATHKCQVYTDSGYDSCILFGSQCQNSCDALQKIECPCGGEAVCTNGQWTCPNKHTECSASTGGICKCVDGAGVNQCTVGSTCGCDASQKIECPCGGEAVCTNGQWTCPNKHTECSPFTGGICKCVDGKGVNSCQLGSSCSGSCSVGDIRECGCGYKQVCLDTQQWSQCPAYHIEKDGSGQCKCVAGWGLDEFGCNGLPDICTNNASAVCNNGKCECTGTGNPQCDTDANCSHTDCNNQGQCVKINSAGNDNCRDSADCCTTDATGNSVSGFKGYSACNTFNSTCEFVPFSETLGNYGYNSCSVDADCTLYHQHTECALDTTTNSYTCQPASGPGQDQCNTDGDCAEYKGQCRQCETGETRNCKCGGTQECVNGTWTECAEHAECTNSGTCGCASEPGYDMCGADSDCTEKNLPSVSGMDVQADDYCTGTGSGWMSLSWTYNNSDASPSGYESKYQIQVARDPGFADKIIDNTVSVSYGQSGSINTAGVAVSPTLLPGALSYGEQFYWRVKVFSGPFSQTESDWFEYGGNPVNYPYSHPGPQIIYANSPENPNYDEPVTFTDASLCYKDDGTAYSCGADDGNGSPLNEACKYGQQCYIWKFNGGGSNTTGSDEAGASNNLPVTHTYSSGNSGSQKTFGTSLTISDYVGVYNGSYFEQIIKDCTGALPVLVGRPPKVNVPDYKELSPF